MFIHTEKASELDSLHAYNNQMISVQYTPMKEVYTRFNAQRIDMTNSGLLRIHPSLATQLFILSLFITGILILLSILFLGSSMFLIGGGMLLLLIGCIGERTIGKEIKISVNPSTNRILVHQSGFLSRSSTRTIDESSIQGIQLLHVTLKAGMQGWQDTDITVHSYEVNLILDPSFQRLWLYSHRDVKRAREAALKIAEYLDVSVVDHSYFIDAD